MLTERDPFSELKESLLGTAVIDMSRVFALEVVSTVLSDVIEALRDEWERILGLDKSPLIALLLSVISGVKVSLMSKFVTVGEARGTSGLYLSLLQISRIVAMTTMPANIEITVTVAMPPGVREGRTLGTHDAFTASKIGSQAGFGILWSAHTRSVSSHEMGMQAPDDTKTVDMLFIS